MKPKTAVKLAVDLLMTVLLFLLMGYQFWGEAAHEWIGAGMIILFIAHHLLNRNWHKNIFKGKYTALRTVTLCVDVLILISMLAQMYSGIVMSRYVFSFLPIETGMSLARRLHILGAFWGFLLMSLHLGLHWNMVLGMVRRAAGPVSSPALRGTLRIGGAAVAVYGLYALVKNQIPSYLLLQSSFVFFDFERPLPLFFTEYPSWGCLFFWPTTVRGECSG